MILKRFFTIIAIAILMIFVQSCNNEQVDNTAKIQLKLVDLAGDYLEVNVNIVDVQYNNSENEEGWKSFESFQGPQIVDLTDLVGGVNLVLSNEVIPAGTLKQIRLVLGDGNTVKIEGNIEGEGDLYQLETPSAQQSGLKLNLDTVLEPGFSYTFILDWDVQQSIVNTGSNKYILKPVIKVTAEANSGSVEGIVTGEKSDDDVEGPVTLEGVVLHLFHSNAAAGDEPYASTYTNSDGYFIFQGLELGNYIIEIELQGYQLYESADLSVNAGEIQDAGIIELTLIE